MSPAVSVFVAQLNFMRVLSVILPIALLIVGVISVNTRERTLLHNFGHVERGMSQEKAVQLLGEPKLINKTCKWEFVDKEVIGCAEVYIYDSPWVINDEHPVVWFDKNKRVIEKYNYKSPLI
jgi:hypothetical protein